MRSGGALQLGGSHLLSLMWPVFYRGKVGSTAGSRSLVLQQQGRAKGTRCVCEGRRQRPHLNSPGGTMASPIGWLWVLWEEKVAGPLSFR